MSMIFGRSTPGPTKINQVQMNQSVLGYALPVLMGAGKIQQSMLWLDGFVQNLITTGGGKGFGGGKDGNQYVYSADAIAGLCAGGRVTGVGDVWTGQSWLSNQNGAETWTITSGLVYAPANASVMTVDRGVGIPTDHTFTANDAGSPGAATATVTSLVGMVRVPYGTTLTSGTYSIDPSNAYHFAAADVGQTVQIGYSFALGVIKKQDTVLIPSGLSASVGGSIAFSADGGVVYATGPNEGKALTLASGTLATGEYSVSGSAPAVYRFAAADVNAEVVITYKLNNAAAIPSGTSTSVNFTLFEGNPGEAVWGLLLTNYPGAALAYPGIAKVAYGPMDLGYGAQIQQNIFELFTSDAWGGGIVDCNPVQTILQVLTNRTWGLGAGAVPFPVSAIDNGASGTWGKPQSTGTIHADSTASSWFAANGFFISPVVDKQDTAASLMSRWLEAGQVAAFMSEGLLKLVPYGDTSTAGNGAVWLAPQSFAFDLDDDDFLVTGNNQDPVKISSSPWQDAYNTVQVQWNNRSNQYSPEITQESDQSAINRYGSRIEDPQTWDFITTLPSAQFAASMRVKRGVYTRNTYSFTLPFRHTGLECMDIGYITTSSQWAAGANNRNLAINRLPVRLTKVVDKPDGTLEVTAEDYPFGIHQPTLNAKHTSTAPTQPNRYADPGDSEVVIFEATSRLTGYAGNEIWMGALGKSANWGKCNVYASTDGDTYKPIGEMTRPARLGVLAADFPSGPDPYSGPLVVTLADNAGPLESGTTADADLDNTLCYVGGELISYSAASVTGVNQVTADTYIRRGRMGSTVADHAAGSLFMRLDDAIFRYAYDPSLYGKTIYLKFQSVNAFNNSPQDLAGLTAVAFVIPGLNPGTVDAETGLVTSVYLPPNVTTNVACNARLSSAYDSTTGTSSVSAFGPGGVGTSWNYTVGSQTRTYPAGTITGSGPGASVYVVYDTRAAAYVLISTASYQSILVDYYIVLGALTTATATGDTTTAGGGAGGGDYGCTVDGTRLDTPDGPVDNRVLKARLDAGEKVYLSGRFGQEQITRAEWIDVHEVYRVQVGVRPAFFCSGSHMLRVAGHFRWTTEVAPGTPVETRSGYEPAQIRRIPSTARVLRITLAGPSNEYSVAGVFTHNMKISIPLEA